ncbi:hypothetical protein HYS82_02160 [Candidatus Amesbacteria bacterium]|nr:hypothetical protein [Candidatus Amesbacteria bacterium]
MWDPKAQHIKVKHILGCTPAHTLYFVVEANDFNALQEFFAPGMTRCLVDIKPVVEMK